MERLEGSDVESWERWEGRQVVRRWKKCEGSEVRKVGEWRSGNVGGSWFYSRVNDTGRVLDFILLFLMLISSRTKEQDRFKIIWRGHRDGRTLLRSYRGS